MVWFKDFELSQPLTIKEKTAMKRKKKIITRSNPINPYGNRKKRIVVMLIITNKKTAKMSGKEIVPEYANAETNGIVKI